MFYKELEMDNRGIDFIAHYVELPVQPLVTATNCLPWATTTFSCGGHYVLESPPKLICYSTIIRVDPARSESEEFIAGLRKIAEQFSPQAYIWEDPNPPITGMNSQQTRFPLFDCGLREISFDGLSKKPEARQRKILEQAHGNYYGKFFQVMEELAQQWLAKAGLEDVLAEANRRRLQVLESLYYNAEGIKAAYTRQLDHDFIKFGR